MTISKQQARIGQEFLGSVLLDRISIYMYTVHMNELGFEWDQRKNRANIANHGVSFEEAQTVFKDENAIQYYDPDHCEDGDRFILLGLSTRLRVVVVCHCFRESELVVRIISARKATKPEQRNYREVNS